VDALAECTLSIVGAKLAAGTIGIASAAPWLRLHRLGRCWHRLHRLRLHRGPGLGLRGPGLGLRGFLLLLKLTRLINLSIRIVVFTFDT
jgi:hypothetical protein